jgi:CYTH domain-containing protein/8-oxo-dGTP pyrophosphatase MutT (NUDIX family)
MEIERKFLLPALPNWAMYAHRKEIRQGYICQEGNREVRVRQIGNKFYLTYKRGSGLVRFEQENQIPRTTFDKLWPECRDRQLIKTRYYHRENGSVLEVDLYRNNLLGLIVAEVEFENEEQSRLYKVPPYFGREITEDTAYSNRMLISNGISGYIDTGFNGYKIGVLPVLGINKKNPDIALVTSRSSGEWILPRGKINKDLPDYKTAELEAEEEAGLLGLIAPENYFIDTKNGFIKFYRLNVTNQLDSWKEKNQRERLIVPWRKLGLFIKDKSLIESLKRFV